MGNRVHAANTSINSQDSFLDHPQEPPSDPHNQLIPTATLRPSIHIKRESVKLTYSNTLTFQYFSHDDIQIFIYFFAIESIKLYGNTECYYIDTEKYPSPVQYDLPAGQGLFFPSNTLSFDPSKYSIQELSFADKKVYPLIIEIRSKKDEGCIERTYCKFVSDENIMQIRVLRQKLTLNDRSFELNEIYGFRRDIQQDCVVCLTDPVSTVVLPCRHYCLCLTCANLVRGQNTSKCPICRIPVETLLNIKLEN